MRRGARAALTAALTAVVCALCAASPAAAGAPACTKAAARKAVVSTGFARRIKTTLGSVFRPGESVLGLEDRIGPAVTAGRSGA